MSYINVLTVGYPQCRRENIVYKHWDINNVLCGKFTCALIHSVDGNILEYKERLADYMAIYSWKTPIIVAIPLVMIGPNKIKDNIREQLGSWPHFIWYTGGPVLELGIDKLVLNFEVIRMEFRIHEGHKRERKYIAAKIIGDKEFVMAKDDIRSKDIIIEAYHDRLNAYYKERDAKALEIRELTDKYNGLVEKNAELVKLNSDVLDIARGLVKSSSEVIGQTMEELGRISGNMLDAVTKSRKVIVQIDGELEEKSSNVPDTDKTLKMIVHDDKELGKMRSGMLEVEKEIVQTSDTALLCDKQQKELAKYSKMVKDTQEIIDGFMGEIDDISGNAEMSPQFGMKITELILMISSFSLGD